MSVSASVSLTGSGWQPPPSRASYRSSSGRLRDLFGFGVADRREGEIFLPGEFLSGSFGADENKDERGRRVCRIAPLRVGFLRVGFRVGFFFRLLSSRLVLNWFFFSPKRVPFRVIQRL